MSDLVISDFVHFPTDVSATESQIYIEDYNAGLRSSCSAIMIWILMTASRAGCLRSSHIQFAQTSPGKINSKPFPADVSATQLKIYMGEPSAGPGGSYSSIMIWKLMTASRTGYFCSPHGQYAQTSPGKSFSLVSVTAQ